MTPDLRKSILTGHICFSVGWLGAVAAFLALAVAGLGSQDAHMVRVAHPAMELTARFVIVPLALVALLSGLIQSFGTRWGLFRHYWILVKLFLTVFATVVLLKKMPLIGHAACLAAEIQSPFVEVRLAGKELVVHAAGGLLVLLAITTLSVFKPWGLSATGEEAAGAKRYGTDTEQVDAGCQPTEYVPAWRRCARDGRVRALCDRG